MKSKNQNIDFNWAKGVDELECGADGENPVDAGTWEKIKTRLEKKDEKKNNNFYWVAAASLLLLIGLAIGFKVLNQKQSVTGDMDAVKRPVINKKSNLPYQKKALPAKKDSGATFVNQASKIIPRIINAAKVIPQKMDTLVFVYTPPVSQPGLQQPDSIQHQPAIVKKTWKITHLNNLVETVETSPGVTMKLKSIRLFIHDTPEDDVEKAALTIPVKKHGLNNSSTIQN